MGQYVYPKRLSKKNVANQSAAEAKNEKFMRFNMGEDTLDDDAGFAGDDEVGVIEDEEGISLR